MITVRTPQLEALQSVAWERFTTELAAHMQSFEPALCKAAGPDGVKEAAAIAVQRAQAHGMKKRGSMALYAELMCVLGSDFENDPQLGWARETLEDESHPGEVTRIDKLHERMTTYLDQVVGPENSYVIKALRRLQASPLLQPGRPTLHDQPFAETLAKIHPEKVAVLDQEVLDLLLKSSSADAERFALPSRDGTLVLAGLKFALGNGICQDPLYPWVSSTLKDANMSDPEARLDRLVKKIRTYLQHVLTHLDG